MFFDFLFLSKEYDLEIKLWKYVFLSIICGPRVEGEEYETRQVIFLVLRLRFHGHILKIIVLATFSHTYGTF